MNLIERFVSWCENHQRSAALIAAGLLILSTLIPGQVPA